VPPCSRDNIAVAKENLSVSISMPQDKSRTLSSWTRVRDDNYNANQISIGTPSQKRKLEHEDTIPSSIPVQPSRQSVQVKPKALYLFAGLARRSDVSDHLRNLGWEVEEQDILRDKRQDLSKPKVREHLLTRVKSNEFAAILSSPPCDTFSRVTFANNLGPKPLRIFLALQMYSNALVTNRVGVLFYWFYLCPWRFLDSCTAT
jgi:hypothetical protein